MAVFETTAGIVLTVFVYFTNGQNLNTTVVFSPSELIRDSNLVNNSLKLALRYGFQQTANCKDFTKAFICVQKCLDLGFEIAHSDRYCFCTCFHKKGKVKSTLLLKVTKTKWRLGAPTTKIPYWASTRKDEKHNDTEDIHYVLIDGNASDIVTDKPTDETEITGDGNSTDVTREVNPHHGDDNSTSATGVTHDGSAKTGGTDVTGTGSHDGTKDPNKGTGGTNASGATEGTEHAQNGTKPNDAPTGGTGAPKADTGGPTTGA